LFTIIFALLAGVVLAFFAIQNTNDVTIVLANMPVPGVPLWIVVITSLLIGLITASYFNVINIVSSAFKLRGKDSAIKSADQEIMDLKHEVSRLKQEVASQASKKDSS
jgi:uncharacterized integral membrane protein